MQSVSWLLFFVNVEFLTNHKSASTCAVIALRNVLIWFTAQNMARKAREVFPTLDLHTNTHAVGDRPTLKDGFERIFRNGSFRHLIKGIYRNTIGNYGNQISLLTKRTENVTRLPNNMTNTKYNHLNGWESTKDEESKHSFDTITSKESTMSAGLGKLPGDQTVLERKLGLNYSILPIIRLLMVNIVIIFIILILYWTIKEGILSQFVYFVNFFVLSFIVILSCFCCKLSEFVSSLVRVLHVKDFLFQGLSIIDEFENDLHQMYKFKLEIKLFFVYIIKNHNNLEY